MAEGYRDVEVRDMDASWKSGLAFCAIIHRFRPDLIDYNSLAKENIFDNNQLAYEVAQKQLNIPAFLEAADMVAIRVPDRLSVITYVSQYYNYFYNKPQLGGPDVNKFGPSSKKKACVQQDETSNRTIVEIAMINKTRPESIGDKCCICHEKVYLLERCIENSKLYHRKCARESESSSTSKVFKRSPLTSFNEDRVDLTSNKVRKIENEQLEPATRTSAARDSEPDFWKRRAEQKATQVAVNPVSTELTTTNKSIITVVSMDKSKPTVVSADKSIPASVSSDKSLTPKTVEIRKSTAESRKIIDNPVSIGEKKLEKPELQINNIEAKLKALDKKKSNHVAKEPDTVTPIPKPRHVTKKQELDVTKSDPKIKITIEHPKQDDNKLKNMPIVNKQNANLGLNLKQEQNRPVSNDLSPSIPPPLPVSSPPVLPLSDSSHVPARAIQNESILQKSHLSDIKVDQDRHVAEAKTNVGKPSPKGQKRHSDSPKKENLYVSPLKAPLTIANMNILNTGSRDSKNVNETHYLRTEKPDLKQNNATPIWQIDEQINKESPISSDCVYSKKRAEAVEFKVGEQGSHINNITAECGFENVNKNKKENTPNDNLKIDQKESSLSPESKKFEHGPQRKILIPDKNVASLVAAKSNKERTQESLEIKNEVGNEILRKKISVNPNFLLDDIKHGPEKGTSSAVNPTSSNRTSKPARPPLPVAISFRSTRHHISVHTLQSELKHIEQELSKLEHKGRTLEDRIRAASDENEEKLMKDWFQLVNDKNELVRKERDYIYISESQELEIKQEQIEQQLQELLNKSDEEKTAEDMKLEEELINEKIAIVDQRSNIVECIDIDRIRYLEEDREIQATLNLPDILRSPRSSVQEESHTLY